MDSVGGPIELQTIPRESRDIDRLGPSGGLLGRIVIKVAQWQPGKGLAFFVGISRYQQCLLLTCRCGTRSALTGRWFARFTCCNTGGEPLFLELPPCRPFQPTG